MERAPRASSDFVTIYREFAPREELRPYVRSLFTFAPPTSDLTRRPRTMEAQFAKGDAFWGPQFAHGHASLVADLELFCRTDGVWESNTTGMRATVIGGMTEARVTPNERPSMVGAYLKPRGIAALLHVRASELTNRTVDLGDIWGRAGRGGVRGSSLATELAERAAQGVEHLEDHLVRQLRPPKPIHGVDVYGLAALVRRLRGRISVDALATAAGCSRQHLTRAFRELIGVTPKVYCRLTRFHAALGFVRNDASWSQVAFTLGYTDQSHMIAEFRQFSGLTPEGLASGPWFHPFMLWSQERSRGFQQQ